VLTDDKIFFWNLIAESIRFQPNHPEAKYIGNVSITTFKSKLYKFTIHHETRKDFSYLSRQFGIKGSFKSNTLHAWIMTNVVQTSRGY
jgi:hypothetical protein